MKSAENLQAGFTFLELLVVVVAIVSLVAVTVFLLA